MSKSHSQVERQGSPRFTVPGFHERAYWFDGNKNPMTMRRWWQCYFSKPFTGVFTFQVLQPKVLVQLRDDDVSFWHPGGTNGKISEQLFFIITEWASLSLSSKCLCPALSDNPLHGCQVWSLHLDDQSGAWVRFCWWTVYLSLNLKLPCPFLQFICLFCCIVSS